VWKSKLLYVLGISGLGVGAYALVKHFKDISEPNESGATGTELVESSVDVLGNITNKNIQITEHFNSKEFVPKSWKSPKFVINRKLVEMLEMLRVDVGRPVVVTSGYRSPEHQKAIGGIANSQHLLGRAADVSIKGYTVDQIANVGLMLGFGGIGRYHKDNFVHLDIGPRRDWAG
jgi:uncharacterized protein YcbK (DUF882 family)